MKISLFMIALGVCAFSGQVSQASTPSASDVARPTANPVPLKPLSPRERGELARQFVLKWGPYVKRVHGVPVRAWAQRMVSTFVVADAQNFRNALKRDTFEGASAELMGTGHRLSDAKVIDTLARRAEASGVGSAHAMRSKALGSLTGDLVYTPIQPCRILDTRVTGGVIAANSTRDFFALSSTYAAQGGSAAGCNATVSTGASAVAINLTAVTPAGAGYATVFPYNTTQPLASSVNYTAGAIVNNALIVQIPNPIADRDFTIFTFAQSHYVADIVGYFSPPQATQFQCQATSLTAISIPANGINFYNNPGCSAGYTAVMPYCYTDAPGVHAKGSGFNGNNPAQPTFCNWQNTTASPQTVFGGTVCCRVPGR